MGIHEGEVHNHALGAVVFLARLEVVQRGKCLLGGSCPWRVDLDADLVGLLQFQRRNRAIAGQGLIRFDGHFIEGFDQLRFLAFGEAIMLAVLLDEFLDEFFAKSEGRILPTSLIVPMDHILEDTLTAAQQLKLGIAHLLEAFQLELLQAGILHIL